MKTTIYGLLGMIKDNKAPKKIMYDNGIWNYRKRTDMKDTILYVEYINEKTCCDLFDEYLITDILNDEVEILETTITMRELIDNSKINELVDKYKKWQKETKPDKIEKLDEWDFSGNDLIFAVKINEIIDKVNKND